MRENINIRTATMEDADAMLSVYIPYVTETAITFEYDVPSVEEFRQRMSQIQTRYPWLAAEMDGELVGYAYAGPLKERAAYDWAVETSIYVKQNQKRKGIGIKLYAELEKCLQKQGILNVNACIAWPENEDEYLTKDSVRFHEKLGYKEVGVFHNCGYKFNRWYHMIWMEKMIGEHVEHQPAVKSFAEMEERFMTLEELLKDERAAGKAESVLELLKELGTVPETLEERILNETDLAVLKKYLILAARSKSIEQFQKEIV